MIAILLALIRGYQAISRGLPRRCRFVPSCSEYTAEAIRCYGAFHGLMIGCQRLLKCHPFHPGGFDPVIDREK